MVGRGCLKWGMTKTYNDSSLWIRHLQVLRARHNGNAYLSVAQDPVHGTDMAVEACWEYILPYDLPKNLTAYWYPERTLLQRRSAHGVFARVDCPPTHGVNRRKAQDYRLTFLTEHSVWNSYLINGVMLSAGRHPGQAEVGPFLKCPFLPLSWPIPSADSTPVTWATELEPHRCSRPQASS